MSDERAMELRERVARMSGHRVWASIDQLEREPEWEASVPEQVAAIYAAAEREMKRADRIIAAVREHDAAVAKSAEDQAVEQLVGMGRIAHRALDTLMPDDPLPRPTRRPRKFRL